MNKVIKFNIIGEYGHFKIPYSNNNPLTYSFITKPALIGLIGCVVGIERNDMKRLYPILCNNLKYSLIIKNTFQKESISSYTCNLENYKNGRTKKSPKPMEYIKNPNWDIYLYNSGDNNEVNDIFEKFEYNIQNTIYAWQPTLGIKQCVCHIEYVNSVMSSKHSGKFTTKTFVDNVVSLNDDDILYVDDIPMMQNEDWFNDPKLNKTLYFVDNNSEIISEGDYYKFNDENICLV